MVLVAYYFNPLALPECLSTRCRRTQAVRWEMPRDDGIDACMYRTLGVIDYGLDQFDCVKSNRMSEW